MWQVVDASGYATGHSSARDASRTFWDLVKSGVPCQVRLYGVSVAMCSKHGQVSERARMAFHTALGAS